MCFDGVLFDLDGTLTDSAPGLLASLRHMHEHLGWAVPTDEELVPWLGPPVATALRDRGHDEATVGAGLAAFRAHLDDHGLLDQRIYDGIPELLAALQAAGTPTGIATFKLQHDAELVAERFGLDPLVSTVHGRIGDEAGHSKAPLMRRALAALGLEPTERVAMVGDRTNDVASALELGLTPIGVSYGYGGEAEVRAAGATIVAHSVAELSELLTA